MPVFEYRCKECNNKFEVFHKSVNNQEEVVCPNCQSSNSKKLFSSFSAAFEGSIGTLDNYNESPSNSSPGGCA